MLDFICFFAILVGLFKGLNKLKVSSINYYPASDNLFDFLIGKNAK